MSFNLYKKYKLEELSELCCQKVCTPERTAGALPDALSLLHPATIVVQTRGTAEYLRQQIEALDLPCFGKTRGMGLMIGIEVKEGYNKSEIANKLIENGLLVLTAGPGMRLLPPLVITREEMDKGVAIMKNVLG